MDKKSGATISSSMKIDEKRIQEKSRSNNKTWEEFDRFLNSWMARLRCLPELWIRIVEFLPPNRFYGNPVLDDWVHIVHHRSTRWVMRSHLMNRNCKGGENVVSTIWDELATLCTRPSHQHYNLNNYNNLVIDCPCCLARPSLSTKQIPFDQLTRLDFSGLHPFQSPHVLITDPLIHSLLSVCTRIEFLSLSAGSHLALSKGLLQQLLKQINQINLSAYMFPVVHKSFQLQMNSALKKVGFSQSAQTLCPDPEGVVRDLYQVPFMARKRLRPLTNINSNFMNEVISGIENARFPERMNCPREWDLSYQPVGVSEMIHILSQAQDKNPIRIIAIGCPWRIKHHASSREVERGFAAFWQELRHLFPTLWMQVEEMRTEENMIYDNLTIPPEVSIVCGEPISVVKIHRHSIHTNCDIALLQSAVAHAQK